MSRRTPRSCRSAQQTALATGGFRRGNVVFAPQGWADRAAEAAALVQMEEEMRERNHMVVVARGKTANKLISSDFAPSY